MSFNFDVTGDFNTDNSIAFDNYGDDILNEYALDFDDSLSSLEMDLENNIDELNEFKKYKNINIDKIDKLTLSRNIHDNRFTISDGTLFCFKAIISPIALIFHTGRFAFSSIGTAFSFAIAFFISDIMFFSMLDKFSLSYARYALLAVTGVIAIASIKGIITSFVNLFLSFFKGIYSWYFSLVDSNCSFGNFLFGRNTITKN